MFWLLLLLFLTDVIHLETKNWKLSYSKWMSSGSNPYHKWNKKPATQMEVNGYANSEWDMGDDWEVSNRLTGINPYYAWYMKAAKQMDMHGPARHVGKINRGQFFNPMFNIPADRAFGYQSDFNPQDYHSSGAFKYKPQGQKFRAKAIHVNEGLASYVGEVHTMPIGQNVQEDGTILVQTTHGGDPCNPNPCTNVRMPMCTVVNKFTAKCSRNKDYRLTLSWANPLENGEDNNLNLVLVPARHDGSVVCNALVIGGAEACGVLLGEKDVAYYDDGENIAEEYATLTTLADGTKYQDFTYAIIIFAYNSEYNLSEGRATLAVEYDGVVKQTLAIPQYRPGGTNINYNPEEERYFFGCFRPQYGYVDTRGQGFYSSNSVFGNYGVYSSGLCKELLDWTDGIGFNPHTQFGSGDETYSP